MSVGRICMITRVCMILHETTSRALRHMGKKVASEVLGTYSSFRREVIAPVRGDLEPVVCVCARKTIEKKGPLATEDRERKVGA